MIEDLTIDELTKGNKEQKLIAELVTYLNETLNAFIKLNGFENNNQREAYHIIINGIVGFTMHIFEICFYKISKETHHLFFYNFYDLFNVYITDFKKKYSID